MKSSGPDRLYLQIAGAIQDDVRRGVLRRGDKLPGTRAVAESLGVHRNTVLAAWRELEAQGWIGTRPSSGTFVTADLPPSVAAGDSPPRARAPGFALADEPARFPLYPALPAVSLPLAAGQPDLRLVPGDLLGRAWRRALASPRRQREVLAYGDPQGLPRLREALAKMLTARRGLACAPDEVLVTRGAQNALYLIGQRLLGPDDVVLVEALGFPPAWGALGSGGARLVPVPIDDRGVDVAAITAWIAAHGPPRAIYVTPHHQHPTMTVLSPGRRARLLELAARHGVIVIEDDYDNEFHFEGRPVRPLAARDPAGVVVYVGTLSKVVAPGLRLGWLVAPTPVVEALAGHRRLVDRQGDRIAEAAMAELLEDGTILRHTRRVRRIYEKRRDALAEALQRDLGGHLDVRTPAGGLAFWTRVSDPSIDIAQWQARCLAAGVGFRVGRELSFDGDDVRHLRLGYASLDEAELAEASRRMRAALG